MQSIDLILSNYRCFPVDSPATLPIRPGVTSIVGPNNAGKSTLLRSTYEFRPLFAALKDGDWLTRLAAGGNYSVQLLGVADAHEAFHDFNSLPVKLGVRINKLKEWNLSGVDLEANRAAPNTWSARFYVGPEHRALPSPCENFPTPVLEGIRVQIDHHAFIEAMRQLESSMYLPAARIAIGQSHGNIYDLEFGRGFIGLWDSWKTGAARAQNLAIQRVTEDIRRLFALKQLEVAATPDKADLHVIVNGRPAKLRELGAGIAQFLIVLANAAVKQPSILLIDEPEISLHPALQVEFLETVASYASGATLVATHSLGLARATDRVLAVDLREGRSRVRDFEAIDNFVEFLGEMSFASYRDLGCKDVLVVEGVNDIRTARQFLRVLGSDMHVAILQLGGSQMISPTRAMELAEVARVADRVFVMIDSERTTAGEQLAETRREFLTTCERLNMIAVATERRALEHYLSDRAVKIVWGPKYRALGHFEARGAVVNCWAKADSWRAAKEMTREELLLTDVGEFLERI